MAYSRYRGNRRSSGGFYAPRTNVGLCAFCCEADTPAHLTDSHERRFCPAFKRLKAGTSKWSYVSPALLSCDTVGFAAAGVLLFRRHLSSGLVSAQSGQGSTYSFDVLMAREYRTEGDKLNFLGGKRLSKLETASGVSIRKLDVELGGQFSKETRARMLSDGFPVVCWSAESKYVLHVFELTSVRDREVDVCCAGRAEEGIKRLEWVGNEQLTSAAFVAEELHSFAGEMLDTLIECNLFAQLERFFDGVEQLDGDTDEGDAEPLDLDVLSAIRAACTNVTGCSPMPTTSRPTWAQLLKACDSLKKTDSRKLMLRFHPDRLPRALRRMPTDQETLMATKACQVLNALFSTRIDRSKADVFNGLDEIDAFRLGDGKDVDDASKRVDAISSLLSELNVNAKE